MLLLAHVGIPVGITWLVQKTVTRAKLNLAKHKPVSTAEVTPEAAYLDSPNAERSSFQLDYRLVMLGSMLPDIIDKPLGLWLFPDTFNNGRILTHTLLFTLLLAAVGAYLWLRRGKSGVLCISFGVVAHLCLDQIWLNPTTFLCGRNAEKLSHSPLRN